MEKIFLINGPNLNLLGRREQSIYGTETLLETIKWLRKKAVEKQVELVAFQSNSEGKIIDFIQSIDQFKPQAVGVIINAAALTHTSIGIRDALSFLDLPFIEVHLSNVYAREKFRSVSYLSDKAVGVVAGLGTLGYGVAMDYFLKKIDGVDATNL